MPVERRSRANADADRYEAYYAEKLWALLPSIYRTEDTGDLDAAGPLRELCARVAVQAAVLRRSIDRLWDDQSIETCDDWVIPYIADLLATNLVPALGARGQRLDVAKTIYYRRRKGTVALIEEIAHDVTGWDVRVVELFRRLSRTRHRLDPPIGWPLDVVEPKSTTPSVAVAQGLLGATTGTPMGGFANLRKVYGATRADRTAFDETFHTADVRRGKGSVGWHGIPRLGIFVWRLRSLRVTGVDPVLYKDCHAEPKLTFDPTGREIPLFACPARAVGYSWDRWVSPREQGLSTPISQPLLQAALRDLYGEVSDHETGPDLRSIAIFDGSVDKAHLIGVEHFTPELRRRLGSSPPSQNVIDAERGILYLTPARSPGVLVSYCYGFSSNIGAGTYDRAVEGVPPPALAPEHHASGGKLPPAILTSGTLVFDDSRTYGGAPPPPVTIAPGGTLVIKSKDAQRPLVRFPAGTDATPSWTFTGAIGGNPPVPSSLWIDGLFVSGGDVELAGKLGTVTLSASTLDPGSWDAKKGALQMAVDGRRLIASNLVVSGHVVRLVVDRCITGPIIVTGSGRIDTLVIQDSIVQALDGGSALDVQRSGLTRLSRVTVLGRGNVHQLEASESILHDVVAVEDYQHGCVRFCAWAKGSVLPRKYECVEILPRQATFTSTAFGQPGYAQLLDAAPATIAAGAKDGSEMGAFSREQNCVKERGLLLKLREYIPVGLAPVVIHVNGSGGKRHGQR